MKNSRKSQIIFSIIFNVIFVGLGATSTYDMGSYLIGTLGYIILTLVSMIYMVARAKKKALAIILDVLAVAASLPFITGGFSAIGGNFTVDELSLHLLAALFNGLSLTLLVLDIALIIALIANFIPKGYFAKNATCSVCGKKVGLNRYKVAKATDGSYIWKCQDCAKRNNGKLLKIDMDTGKAEVIPTQDTEVKVKCNTCGHVYCYNLSDLQRNRQLAKGALVDSVLGVTEAVGGTRIGSQVANARAESKLDKVVDYSRCPHCHSTDVRTISKEEWDAEKAKNNSAVLSSADELKKFKELLDMGAITQEEFDAKKKQLLGL